MPASRPKSAFSRAARKTLLAALFAGTAITGTFCYLSRSDADIPDNIRPLDTIKIAQAPTYITRVKDQPELDRLCDLPGKKPVGEQWAGISRLQAYGGSFTRGLLSYANAASIYSCYYNAPDLASTFDAEAGIARINKTSLADMMLQNVHGTVHGHQRNESRTANDGSWDLYSRIVQKASSEAVAYVAEFVAATEMQQQGNNELVTSLDKKGAEGWETFKRAFQSTASLEKASSITVSALLRDRNFVSYHADEAIDRYFFDLQAGRISANAANRFGLAELKAMGTVAGFSFAAEATLPTERELLNIAPELSRATGVLSGKPNQDVVAKIAQKRSGSSYTVRQALTRIDGEQSGDFNYSNRASIGGVFQNCAQADYKYAQVPDATKDLWQNLQTIKQGPLMGAAIYDFSNKANIFHCYFRMDAANAGEWYDNDGLVRISDKGWAPQSNVLTSQAHELIHGIQRTNNVRAMDPSWTIHEFQMMRLAHEAAARTGQYLLAFELNEAGYAGPLEDARNRYIGPESAAENAYVRARNAGQPAAAALTAAGTAGWNAQFSDRDWADSYNNNILRDFISMIVNNGVAAPSGKAYPLETARMTGWISKDLNFTSGLTSLPAFKDRFGGNDQMRQAFEYVNLEHIAYTTGRTSPQYTQELQRLQTEKNPYLGVDLRVINNTLNSPQTTLTPLGAMNCFGGVSSSCTYGGKNLNPNQYKIKMKPVA
ncbi:MAG: hypothetical protein EPN97_00985 [Alphaproteobacteria bacterium]|nr:MAG: hypothetical protein EPN97_00985 [Alphaproteobacteria bacterium]